MFAFLELEKLDVLIYQIKMQVYVNFHAISYVKINQCLSI